jgi:hypothetical protein
MKATFLKDFTVTVEFPQGFNKNLSELETLPAISLQLLA